MTLVLAAVLAGLAAWPAGASSQLRITDATLHPGTNNLSSPPGGVMHCRASVAGVNSTTAVWRGTQVVWTPVGGGATH
jgi:hypothetical protein